MPTWRYEFVATGQPHSDLLVLDGGQIQEPPTSDAGGVLASAIRNIKVSGPTKPNAIRLLDPIGHEVWRAKLQHRKWLGSRPLTPREGEQTRKG